MGCPLNCGACKAATPNFGAKILNFFDMLNLLVWFFLVFFWFFLDFFGFFPFYFPFFPTSRSGSPEQEDISLLDIGLKIALL